MDFYNKTPEEEYKMWRACYTLARRYHKGQKRSDGKPYFKHHVMQVAGYFIKKKDWKRACVAVLHDVVEDTPCTRAMLSIAGVPPRICDAVYAITKQPGEPYEDYLGRVMGNTLAWKVKIQDVLHNLTDNPDRRRIRKYAATLLTLTENPPESVIK